MRSIAHYLHANRFSVCFGLLAVVAAAIGAHLGYLDAAHGMLLIGATLPTQAGAATLLDFAKSLDPDGKTAKVVELLNQTNEILTEMQWKEGNLTTGERTTVRTGLPLVVWRKLYGGVPASKSTRAQVDEATGMLEARSEVDKDLADLNGNTNEFRLSEAMAFLEAMNQGFAQQLFYGDASVHPERFNGLAQRYSSLSAGNAQNVITLGGDDNANHSIWLIVWGPNTVTGIFPKGSTAGIMHQNLGEGDAFDDNGDRYRAYMDRWQWKPGLALRDWRYAVRICNIDHTSLLADTNGSTVKLLEAMIRAIARIPSLQMGKPVFYCDRTIKEMLEIQAMNKSANTMALKEGADQFTATSFKGIPIRLCDQLLATEANVS